MSAEQPLKVLVYSDDRNTREQIRLALGRSVADDLPALEIVDTATAPATIRAVDATHFDALIFDGEATPVGGMGLCYQLKDEVANCPPIMVLIARRDDSWLGTWSKADALTAHPVDPVTFPRLFADMVRKHRKAVANA